MNPRLDLLRRALQGRVDNLVLLESADSTHSAALRLIQQMDEEGLDLEPTVIVAEHQELGMGRGGRSWISPRGGLYLSWLRSGLEPDVVARLPMLAAAAAHGAVAGLGVHGVALKWPNDVLIGTAKLAGILVHARHGERTWATVGLGVNVAATPIMDDPPGRRAAALVELITDADPDALRAELAGSFVDRLLAAIEEPAPAIAAWRDALVHRPGDTLRVRLASGEELHGTLSGLSVEGYLRLAVNGAERVITGGDIVEPADDRGSTH